MKDIFVEKHPDIKTLNSWVAEAAYAFRDWRAESWRDCEMYDGGQAQWDFQEWEDAKAAGMNPLTINRTFPIVNLLIGAQALNKFEVIAKGRTQFDTETADYVTEAIKFIMDQNDGEFLISAAFKDQVIPGFGCLSPCLNPDPRKEKIRVVQRDWKEMWWDPFGASPWFSPNSCRYVFFQRWVELSELIATFPEKRRELEDQFGTLTGSALDTSSSMSNFQDEATLVEQERLVLGGSDWADARRKRVRPVELWYPRFEKGWFAVFPNGDVIELTKKQSPRERYTIVHAATEVVGTIVRKMYTATFLNDLVLQAEVPSPYPHDEFPYVPFVGYIDRWGHPYGLPRQIRGQDEEVNKRRTMALALLKARRVILESDIVENADQHKLQDIYEEANKLDGFIVTQPGKSRSIIIQEQAQLMPSQIALLEQSEKEMQEMVGANDDRRGLQTNATSGKAIEARQQAGAIMTAGLFDNLRRSLKILGTHLVANMQGFWTQEKVLRITDRLTSADKFIALNQRIRNNDGVVTIRNNITQGKYDIVVSDAPISDTVREQNMNLVIEWVKKSPPEVIPHLINVAFELSNLPNKEKLLARIRPLLGMRPGEENLTAEEVKQKVMQEFQAQVEAQKQQAAIAAEAAKLQLQNQALQNEKIKAEIRNLQEKARVDRAQAVTNIKKRRSDIGVQEVKATSDAKYKDDRTALASMKIRMEQLQAARAAKMPSSKAPEKKQEAA